MYSHIPATALAALKVKKKKKGVFLLEEKRMSMILPGTHVTLYFNIGHISP